MQKILGHMRRAIEEYSLIQDGDKIAVGISGGKDSMVLLEGLCRLKRFIGIDYEVKAITVDPQFNGNPGDYSAVAKRCKELGVEYIIKPTDIWRIVFDIRHEKSPCSLCARMRRGALHDEAIKAGCGKIALGHHFDDAVETFIMNLFIEGRIDCFAPKNCLSKKDLTLIRPLVFATEKEIKAAAAREKITVTKSACPVDGVTKRQETKEFLAAMEAADRGFKERLFGAMRRGDVGGFGSKKYGGML